MSGQGTGGGGIIIIHNNSLTATQIDKSGLAAIVAALPDGDLKTQLQNYLDSLP